MSARFVDALKGYEYFLSKRGKASLDEINHFLIRHDRRPISERTIRHYQKLLSQGFRSYIPINQFDVFQSLGKIQMAADRRRYVRREVEKPAQISKGGKRWVKVSIIDESLVGFGMISMERFGITPGSQLMIRIEGYRDFPVVVVWREHHANYTRMGVRALEYIARYCSSDIDMDRERLTGLFRITRVQEADLEWGNLYRILEKTDEIFAALTDLLITVGEVVKTDLRIARPVLSSIQFRSQGGVEIKVDFCIAEILKVVLEKLQPWGIEKRRYAAETTRQEIENVNLAIETTRNAINLRKEVAGADIPPDLPQSLLVPLKRVLNVAYLPENIFDPESLESGILNERVLPAATELIAGDDLDFEVEVGY